MLKLSYEMLFVQFDSFLRRTGLFIFSQIEGAEKLSAKS